MFLALGGTLTGQAEEARGLYHELTKRLEAAHEPWENFTAALELSAKETTLLDALVEDRPGTVLRLLDDPAFTAFVSDKNTDQPQAYWRRGTANWTLLGAMEDVQ